MHKITNNRELRIAYEMLQFWNEMAPQAKDPELLAEHIKEMKLEIRKYHRRPVSETIVVKDDGMDGAILLEPLPETIKSKEAAREYFEENRWMNCRPSMYDCTGQMFSTWYRIIRRAGRFWAYHSIAFDV